MSQCDIQLLGITSCRGGEVRCGGKGWGREHCNYECLWLKDTGCPCVGTIQENEGWGKETGPRLCPPACMLSDCQDTLITAMCQSDLTPPLSPSPICKPSSVGRFWSDWRHLTHGGWWRSSSIQSVCSVSPPSPLCLESLNPPLCSSWKPRGGLVGFAHEKKKKRKKKPQTPHPREEWKPAAISGSVIHTYCDFVFWASPFPLTNSYIIKKIFPEDSNLGSSCQG